MKKKTLAIRQIQIGDAKDWLELLKKLSQESEAMLYTDKDRSYHLENCKRHIQTMLDEPGSMIFVAESTQGQLVGYMLCEVAKMFKRAHTLIISGGALADHQCGLIRIMMPSVIEYARTIHIKRIELSALQSNKVCINGYKKLGFSIEGIKKAAVKMSSGYEDECMMGLLL